MLYLDIILIDDDIDLTIKKLRELCPSVDWQTGYGDHDLGGYYYVCVDDEAEGFDEKFVYEVERLFNERKFDEIEYI